MQTQIQREASVTTIHELRKPSDPPPLGASARGPLSAPRLTRVGVGFLKIVAIGTLLSWTIMPISAYAQGKGGGKPGGGGGGEEPPPGGDPECLYTLERIEVPAGTEGILPLGMNNHAHVVGASHFKSGKNDKPGPAFHWADGVYTALPALQPDAPTDAWAIADNGLIVGGSYGILLKQQPGSGWLPTDPRAVWWMPNESGFEVGDWNDAFPAGFFAEAPLLLRRAEMMSDDGRIVYFRTETLGFVVVAQIAAGNQTPPVVEAWWVFEANRDVQFRDLHHDGAGTVRAAGHADGESVIWLKTWDSDNFVSSPVPTYDGEPIRARGINGKGELAGNVTLGAWAEAVFIGADQIPQLMGWLGSGTRSVVSAINDHSCAVGWATIDSKDQVRHAFIWHPDTGMVDLNPITDRGSIDLVDTGNPGSIMNNAGHIVARGKQSNSSMYVLLSPVP